MKRYKRFMNGVKAPGTLEQRLKALKEPKQKPAWTKYGALAAAFVLVFGLGGYGLSYLHTAASQQMFRDGAQVYHPEGDVSYRPGPGTYEYIDPRFEGMGVASFIVLPDIEYTQAGNPNRYAVAADWDLPQGALRRDMSREHIAYLLGGEDALSTHLDWDDYELSGWAAWYEDGDFWGAYIDGYAGELDHFTFAVTAGQLPPTCFEFPDIEEQDVQGVMVTAVGYDSTASTRQVSFMKEGYGYRFDLTGTDRELAEQRVSRLVRLVADDGLALWTLDPKVETYTCPDCGQQFPVGEEKAHVHSFPGAGESSAPAVSADPGYAAPAISAEPSYICPQCGVTYRAGTEHRCELCRTLTCPDCGASYPAGEAHYHTQTCEICGRDYPVGSAHGHPFMGGDTETCPDCGASYPAGEAQDCAMCDGYPLPHICEICGEAYPEGTAHSHEICGYPLAPDTQTCAVCGQTIPAGAEHSHQQEHHQEQHHGNHHG